MAPDPQGAARGWIRGKVETVGAGESPRVRQAEAFVPGAKRAVEILHHHARRGGVSRRGDPNLPPHSHEIADLVTGKVTVQDAIVQAELARVTVDEHSVSLDRPHQERLG